MIETFKALSDPCRLRLIALLLRGEFTVQELTGIIGAGQSRISHHLKILTEAGILEVKRQGTWNYYRISETKGFFSNIREIIERELSASSGFFSDATAVALVLEARRKKSQDFFESHARQWEELSRRLLPLPEYKQLLIDSVPNGCRLLEIGVGTGDLLISLATVSADVIGVDNSTAMLGEAGRKISACGGRNVSLRLGDMHHLPIPDNTVDCVVANMVLHHAADPVDVITEIKRVLKQDGRILIADLIRHDQEFARDQLADQWLGFDESELKSWLSLVGFKKTDIKIIPAGAGEASVFLITASL